MTTDDAHPPKILLVHGYWFEAWCWTEVAARLAGAGRQVLAVDLAGHGLRARWPASATARPFDPEAFVTEVSPVASVDLDEAGDLLVSQIEEFSGGEPVVVVAHSAAGTVLTRAAQVRPHLVRRAVYLAAYMPASEVSVAVYSIAPEQDGNGLAPLYIGDPVAIGAGRLDVGADGGYRRRLREALCEDVPEETAHAAIALMTPDASMGVSFGTTTLTADGWGSVPRTYVRCTQDHAIRPAMQQRFVAEADAAFPDNPTTVVELESSHSPLLSRPRALADLIAAAR